MNNIFQQNTLKTIVFKLQVIRDLLLEYLNLNALKTRPTYPLERQLIKASEPLFDLKGGAQGQM